MAEQKKDSGISKERYLKVAFLSKAVLKDVQEVLTHYNLDQKLELTDHFIKLFDELREYSETKDFVIPLQKFTNREMELLKKFRHAYKPYEAMQFAILFDFNSVLLEKGFFTEEEFNALPKEERRLKDEDIITFCNYMDRELSGMLYDLYLEDGNVEKVDADLLGKEETDQEMTEARRLLAIYFLFKATLGIEHRRHTDISHYARFAHLLLGKKITKLENSNIYKKYKKLPYFNKGQQLIKDLQYIKPFFAALELQKAVDMIEKEIETESEGPKD